MITAKFDTHLKAQIDAALQALWGTGVRFWIEKDEDEEEYRYAITEYSDMHAIVAALEAIDDVVVTYW